MRGLIRKFGALVGKTWKSPTYDAILYRRCVISPNTYSSKSALKDHIRSIFENEDIKVDYLSRRVGNREGLSWMDRVEDRFNRQDEQNTMLQEEAKAGKEAIAGLQEEAKAATEAIARLESDIQAVKWKWFLIRATEIEKQGRYRTQEVMLARRERNEMMHGGHILGDLQTVGAVKTKLPIRGNLTQGAFESWYEVSPPYADQSNSAPEIVIKAFNTLADTKSLYEWGKCPTARNESRKLCRGIISKWLNHVNAADVEYPEEEIKKEYEKLVKIGGDRIRP